MKRILIAYFSREGQNFVNGSTTKLEKGNTEKIADFIQKKVGGDLFPIQPVKPYSSDYQTCLNESKAEKESNARPSLKGKVEGMESYDVIFLGYPNWWGTCPMPVLSFLEQYDLSGKTIITFCTHEGSRSLYSVADIQASAKGARVIEGQAINGSYLSAAEPTLMEWLDSLRKELE
jgi:flavodoxin